jgi:hypothetical protein
MGIGVRVAPGIRVRTRLVLPLAVLVLLVLPAGALAQDLEAQLAAAEANAAEARADIASLEPRLAAAGEDLRPIAAAAARANERAARALDRAESIEDDLVAEREQAGDRIEAAQAAYQDDLGQHDQDVQGSLGAALGFFVLALIALAWSRFRSLPPVQWVAGLTVWPAIGVCVGGGLALVLVGGAMIGVDGPVRVLGGFLILLGLGLGVALLMARHSLHVERGVGGPLLSRERLPRWVALSVAVVFALLFVGFLADGLFSDEPDEPVFSEELQQLAAAAEGDPADPPSDELKRALAAAEPLVAQADNLDAAREEAQQAIDEARSQLAAARQRLDQAERAARRYSEEIAQLAARAARRAEREARQAARAPAPSSPAPSPSYSSCDTAPDNIPVPPGSPLDADGDGVGCET